MRTWETRCSFAEVINSRITCSTLLSRLGPEAVEQFILAQFDRAGLGYDTFSQEALDLTVHSGEALLRRTRSLCLGSLTEAGWITRRKPPRCGAQLNPRFGFASLRQRRSGPTGHQSLVRA
jgi:hypothetical protein